MSMKLFLKWSALLSGATVAAVAVPGCDTVTQLIEQLLGSVTGGA
jgi:hypothetical protein